MEIEQIKILLDKVHAEINDINNVDRLEELLECYYYLIDYYNKSDNKKK